MKRLVYLLVRKYAQLVVYAFFRKVVVVGSERIPLEGPVIFISNHANKFVDAAMLIAVLPRKLLFLIAAVSLKQLLIGPMARAIDAIGIYRPQDNRVREEGLAKCLKCVETTQALEEALLGITGSPVEPLGISVEESRENRLYTVIVQGLNTRFLAKIEPEKRISVRSVTLVVKKATAKR